MTARSAIQHCPYCAGEDLVPELVPELPGAWRCRSCARVFAVTLVGLGAVGLGAVGLGAEQDAQI
jgi:hypothetical protein